MFWAGDAFDYAIPFRSILMEIAEALEQNPQIDLQLPVYDGNEDFVEGALLFGASPLGVYYEYSLGYLLLTSDSDVTLREAAARIQKIITTG